MSVILLPGKGIQKPNKAEDPKKETKAAVKTAEPEKVADQSKKPKK